MLNEAEPEPAKRARRTKTEMQEIRDGLYEIVESAWPMSVRQVFYQAVTRSLVEKTELAYQTTIMRLLLELRRNGVMPYDWIADGTRWMRKPATYTGLAAFIERHHQAYRRDLWADGYQYVEIWCEKEALAGVLIQATWDFDVPLMVSRGFASESYIYSAAEAINEKCYGDSLHPIRHASIYYLGDHDPSGRKIDPAIERSIRRILVDVFEWPSEPEGQPLEFERIAVTEEQIEDWDLPTRPTKLKGNPHAKNWDEDEPSVELDAIHPDQLRTLVRDAIEQHVNEDQLAELRAQEEREREQLRVFGQQLDE